MGLPEALQDDGSIDPVLLNGEKLSVLMWADNVLVLSLSASGLQSAIDQTYQFFCSLGLSANEKKTKVLIFNPRGLTLKDGPNNNFHCGPFKLEVCEQYTYLGIVLRPSGSFTLAVDELYTKASKAWFSISNTIYQNKKLPVSKAYRIFDSLITPITLYCCELWTAYLVKLLELRGVKLKVILELRGVKLKVILR